MYVKLFNRILGSSIAKDRKLRHFFTDLLLLADPDGNVILTKDSIARSIKASDEEVEWGLRELMKPDRESLTPDHEGRRVIPLEGHGYGWHIVNYAMYRDTKSAKELRDKTAERVRKHRAKAKESTSSNGTKFHSKSRTTAAERAFCDNLTDKDLE